MLVEIGPRFVLDLVRIFAGSLGGPTLYSNPRYLSPNRLRYELNAQKASRYVARKDAEEGRERRDGELVLPKDPLAGVFRDEEEDGEEGGDGDGDGGAS